MRGDPSNPAVQLVAAQFGPDTKISDLSGSLGSDGAEPNELGVVVVIGDDFEKLGRKVGSVRAEEDTTICIPAGFSATVDAGLALHLCAEA